MQEKGKKQTNKQCTIQNKDNPMDHRNRGLPNDLTQSTFCYLMRANKPPRKRATMTCFTKISLLQATT